MNVPEVGGTMLRDLLASEICGRLPLIEAVRCQRWATLRYNPSLSGPCLPGGDRRRIVTQEIDSLSGEFLLAGGQDAATATQRATGCLGLVCVRNDERENARSPTQPPLAWSGQRPAPIVKTAWLPGEQGLFVTGDQSGYISAWDAEEFSAVLVKQVPVIDEDVKVTSLHMSPAVGRRDELVAVSSDTKYVNLLDLGSGAFAQVISGNTSNIADVRWSPSNPYLLASAGLDGSVRLFDIRRGGAAACLYSLDMNRTLLSSSIDRLRTPSNREMGTTTEGPAKRQRLSLLGMGTAWEDAGDVSSASMLKRKRRRKQAVGRERAAVAHGGAAVVRVRFTPDGRHIVTGGKDRRIRVWDATTARCVLSSFESLIESGVESFEVAGDSSLLYALQGEGFVVYDIANGSVVSSLSSHTDTVSSFAVHPIDEKIAAVGDMGDYQCWTPDETYRDALNDAAT